ncbi:MAG TPA: PAS domain S-box protein, partial [Verrucomicrobiae bacterium]|nr:PAS domain S-box protein [Verrucomicrobiae bacterium]
KVDFLEEREGEKRSAERALVATNELLQLFANSFSRAGYLESVVRLLQEWTGCRCVGIRVTDRQGNIPYDAFTGFSQSFWESENWLSLRRDHCACTRVITGAPDPRDRECLTGGGSFCCNDLPGFAVKLSPEDSENFRGRCIESGFSTIGVIPIRFRRNVVGAVHLADERHGMLPQPLVRFLEKVAPVIGEVIHRFDMEEALRRSEDTYRSLFETSRDMVYITDAEGRIVDVNSAGEELTGYTRDELLMLDFTTDLCWSAEDRKRFRDELLRTGCVRDCEMDLRRKSGDRVHVLATGTLIRNENAEVAGYRGIIRDVTEKKRLEHQLVQSQKMESIGMFAGGVAHDFNNMLTVIRGYAQIVLEKVEGDEETTLYAQEVLKAAERAGELTSNLLAFSRNQVIDPRPVELNALVADMGRFLQRVIGENIELEIFPHRKALVVKGEGGRLEQVLANLAVNARDAMPEGGKLSLQTTCLTLSEAEQRLHNLRPAERYACISVTDTGCGMEPDIVERVFDPFFTTKAPGRGTGLGLSIVYGIVVQHGGAISVESFPGSGTVFRIFLPLEDAGEMPEAEAPSEVSLGGSETLLLVEDEEAVRICLEQILCRAGYQVVAAADGEEGLQRFAELGGGISLVVTDVVMPRKNGLQMFEEMKKANSGVKGLFMSGYTDDVINTQGMEGGLNLIMKPLRREEFLQRVREVIDGG